MVAGERHPAGVGFAGGGLRAERGGGAPAGGGGGGGHPQPRSPSSPCQAVPLHVIHDAHYTAPNRHVHLPERGAVPPGAQEVLPYCTLCCKLLKVSLGYTPLVPGRVVRSRPGHHLHHVLVLWGGGDPPDSASDGLSDIRDPCRPHRPPRQGKALTALLGHLRAAVIRHHGRQAIWGHEGMYLPSPEGRESSAHPPALPYLPGCAHSLGRRAEVQVRSLLSMSKAVQSCDPAAGAGPSHQSSQAGPKRG